MQWLQSLWCDCDTTATRPSLDFRASNESRSHKSHAVCVGRIAVPLQSRRSCNRCIRHHQARSRTSQYPRPSHSPNVGLQWLPGVQLDWPQWSTGDHASTWTSDYPSLNFTLLRLRYGHARRQSDVEKGFGEKNEFVTTDHSRITRLGPNVRCEWKADLTCM